MNDDPLIRPERDIAGCRSAHARLAATLDVLTEADVPKPSLAPGWTVGHVLTHLARNADSVVRRIEGAARNELLEQYPGEGDAREAQILRGSGRSSQELIDDVLATSARVDQIFAVTTTEVWGRSILRNDGSARPAARQPWSRWREVEIHLVDLDLGATLADTPSEFMDRLLEELIQGLPSRTERAPLVAWLLGRGKPPRLSPWA